MDREWDINQRVVDVGVSYDSDVTQVENILIELAKSHKLVLNNPSPMVLLQDFGESSLNFRLCFSINNSFIANQVKSDIRFKIIDSFNENKIQIPFPQRTLVKPNRKSIVWHEF